MSESETAISGSPHCAFLATVMPHVGRKLYDMAWSTKQNRF